jgi:hypothetical protein
MLHGPEAAHRTLVAYLAERRQPAETGRLSPRLDEAVPNAPERLVQHFKHWRQ